MNIKPATPLPQGVPPDAGIYIGNLYTTPRTIAIWREKAEAYPELMERLDTLCAMLQWAGERCKDTDKLVAERANHEAASTSALLAKLGEV